MVHEPAPLVADLVAGTTREALPSTKKGQRLRAAPSEKIPPSSYSPTEDARQYHRRSRA